MSAADLRAGLAKVKQEKADAAERTFVSLTICAQLTMLGRLCLICDMTLAAVASLTTRWRRLGSN